MMKLAEAVLTESAKFSAHPEEWAALNAAEEVAFRTAMVRFGASVAKKTIEIYSDIMEVGWWPTCSHGSCKHVRTRLVTRSSCPPPPPLTCESNTEGQGSSREAGMEGLQSDECGGSVSYCAQQESPV
jgi:hypothetical protein